MVLLRNNVEERLKNNENLSWKKELIKKFMSMKNKRNGMSGELF